MRDFVTNLFKRRVTLILVVLVLINIAAILYFLSSLLGSTPTNPEAQKSLGTPEISAIIDTKDPKIREEEYIKLIERVGPVQAQEQLYRSGLPFDGESHLVNHAVGEWLYEKYKTKGIAYCKDYFLSSCYHGFLIEVIAGGGIKDLKVVMDVCNEKGKTTSVQCAHAIGHGLLAWEDYANLPKALSDCDIVASLQKEFIPYNCYDGVFMENNWAVHDGVPSPDRWVKEDDPTYPCYDSRIAEKYRRACWSNQPQVMHKLFSGDISKVAKQCEDIAAKEYQDTCFDSLARQINPLSNGDVDVVFSMCNMMPVGWKSACVISNVSAFFSVGDRELPFTLCEMIPPSGTAKCYEALQQRIATYIPTFSERVDLCMLIPKSYLLSYCPARM